jgi:hypothetical protein
MLILDQLEVDIDYMLNEHEDGHVVMDSSNNHGITAPTALMDVGHHVDDLPRNLQRNR